MNANEIKNAWNRFKKELAKEVDFDLTGCCYMNKKQLENGTATIALCNDIDYDYEIARERRDIDRVNSYNSWTAEKKQNHERRSLETISGYEARKSSYGTKENEARVKFEQITKTKAYKALVETIGVSLAEIELVKKWEGLSVYQIRIIY